MYSASTNTFADCHAVVVADGGMSLLKHPSAAVAKLLVGGNGSGRPSLQRPVMAFVQQRHDLDSLQLAMKQGLRKAACRVFALQVGALHYYCTSVLRPLGVTK